MTKPVDADNGNSQTQDGHDPLQCRPYEYDNGTGL